MKMGNIRNRMLLAALLPVTLVALLLAGVFFINQVSDIGDAHSQRARALARQFASASEYGLFSANIANLQTVANGALRASDVRSVAILDARGTLLAHAGKPGYTTLPVLDGQESEQLDPVSRLDLLLQPVSPSPVRLDDLFQASVTEAKTPPPLLGHVLIEFSRGSLDHHERQMILVGLAAMLGGLLFGGLLALRLGRGVIQPILRVSNTIERIGRGELSARAEMLPGDPLRDLQRGLNQMAERLELGRDELERSVAIATVELREKKEKAEMAGLAKSRFLAVASHDLRQPTHALGMFVARLAQLPNDGQTKSLIGNLEVSVRALQDLLDGLLDISRLDAQVVQVQLRAFPLSDLFEQLGAGLMLTAQDRGLRLRVRPTRVWLMSDPTLLHRILLNLVGNALRYTRKGGVLVACRLICGGTHTRIEVWDSGIGIAPEHQQAIFKEFYQVGNTERDRSKGMGLGLYIVERATHLLGHRLQMCSVPGFGTRFSVEVPLVPQVAAMEQRSLAPTPPFGDLAGLVVLVIEDDAQAREALAGLLASWGSSVVVADGLASALRQLEGGRTPDVIVSDYRLRDKENGIDTVHQLRSAIGQSIPACLMSGDTDPDLMQAARDAGLTLLHKPVRPAKLRSLIRRLATPNQVDSTDRV